jgi:hypothetical protein
VTFPKTGIQGIHLSSQDTPIVEGLFSRISSIAKTHDSMGGRSETYRLAKREEGT